MVSTCNYAVPFQARTSDSISGHPNVLCCMYRCIFAHGCINLCFNACIHMNESIFPKICMSTIWLAQMFSAKWVRFVTSLLQRKYSTVHQTLIMTALFLSWIESLPTSSISSISGSLLFTHVSAGEKVTGCKQLFCLIAEDYWSLTRAHMQLGSCFYNLSTFQ